MSIKEVKGGYEVRVATNYQGKYLSLKRSGIKTVGEARRIEKELTEELVLMKRNGKGGKLTWADALAEYLPYIEKRFTASTYVSAKTALEAHCGAWNSIPAEELFRDRIEKELDERLKGRTVSTKNNVVKYVRGVFRYLVDRGKLTHNPANGIFFDTADGLPRMKEKKLEAMSRNEIEMLLRKAREMEHPWYPIFRVTYELGLRAGEAIALRWTSIDFERKRVHVAEAYCSKARAIGPTKNRKPRVLPLSPSLEKYLKELKLARGQEEFVLPQFSDWKAGRGAKILRSLQKELGIRQTNFHSLRASFITHLLLDGISVTKVQHLVGHADLKTTQRYVRLVAADLDGATDSLGTGLDLDSTEAKVIPLRS